MSRLVLLKTIDGMNTSSKFKLARYVEKLHEFKVSFKVPLNTKLARGALTTKFLESSIIGNYLMKFFTPVCIFDQGLIKRF